MEIWESTKAEVYFNVDGQEKQVKQNMGDVIETPEASTLNNFAVLLQKIAPVTHNADSTVLVTRKRYTV